MPHKIFQILPTTATGKVFNNQSVLSTNRRSIFISSRLSPTAISATTPTVLTAAAVAVPVPVAAGAAGVLHDHALPAQILAVQLVNGIVGVAGVLKLHEAVTVFEVDLEQAAVAAEETLDVLLPDMVAQTADVHARHIRGRRGKIGRAHV